MHPGALFRDTVQVPIGAPPMQPKACMSVVPMQVGLKDTQLGDLHVTQPSHLEHMLSMVLLRALPAVFAHTAPLHAFCGWWRKPDRGGHVPVLKGWGEFLAQGHCALASSKEADTMPGRATHAATLQQKCSGPALVCREKTCNSMAACVAYWSVRGSTAVG